jgi:hypothetical protein
VSALISSLIWEPICLTSARWDERTLAQVLPEQEQTLDIASSASTEALEFDVALTDSTVLGDAMQRAGFDLSSINLDLAGDDAAAKEAPTTVISGARFHLRGGRRIPWSIPVFAMEVDRHRNGIADLVR